MLRRTRVGTCALSWNTWWETTILTATRRFGDPGTLPGATVIDRYHVGLKRAVAAVQAEGILDQALSTDIGDMSGFEFITSMLFEVMVHGWDLARATGQDTAMDPECASVAYEAAVPYLAAKRLEHEVGPEVTPPAGASIEDRLAALFGQNL
jgi:uncharacterized protein (TIGR03086 family)